MSMFGSYAFDSFSLFSVKLANDLKDFKNFQDIMQREKYANMDFTLGNYADRAMRGNNK